ncbi:hypothetical protein ACG7TL_008709 [Trametes sanguinea]
MKNAFTILIAALASDATARTFTIHNQCYFTIWPAIFTDLNVGSAMPDQPTGWQQDAFQIVSFFVPDNWQAGRIWARRDCNFDVNPGPNSCLDGGCNGGLECDPHTGTGVPPATLAEFNLGVNGVQDSYAVSVVDGSNLAMRISNNQGCHVADCPVDLGPDCPAPLKGPFDSNGFAVGCKSACDAGLGDPVNNPNCCTGTFNNPSTCTPSGVDFYSYFKGNCPNAYAYAFDDPSALFHCSNADYTITFCP